jgi:hypothetical protein
MHMDIRIPIGLMFATVGGLLAAYGLLGDQSIYGRSLGINVNLIWGIVLIIVSVVLLSLALHKRHTK